jgi:hypothetical protein
MDGFAGKLSMLIHLIRVIRVAFTPGNQKTDEERKPEAANTLKCIIPPNAFTYRHAPRQSRRMPYSFGILHIRMA